MPRQPHQDPAQTRRLGLRVRQLRLEAGLTLSALALLAKQDRSFIARVESGDRAPSFRTLEDLCDGLRVSRRERRRLRTLAGYGMELDPVAARLAELLDPDGGQLRQNDRDQLRTSVSLLIEAAANPSQQGGSLVW